MEDCLLIVTINGTERVYSMHVHAGEARAAAGEWRDRNPTAEIEIEIYESHEQPSLTLDDLRGAPLNVVARVLDSIKQWGR